MGYVVWVSECSVNDRRELDAAMAHAAGFGAHAESFLAAVTPTRFVVFGSPSEALKQALTDFGPAYATPIGGFHR